MVVSHLMTRKILCVLLFFGGLTLAAAEQIVELENKAYWLCKNHKEVRTIRVHVNGQGVCSTMYTKLGDEKVVGSGKNHESCLNFLNNIKTNLEKSNWNCRDISATRISASVEE
jgi:hypothetical protein